MDFTKSEKTEILKAADNIQKILKSLPTPRHAANALAMAQAGFIFVAGASTEKQARVMLAEANSATLQNWAVAADQKLAS